MKAISLPRIVFSLLAGFLASQSVHGEAAPTGDFAANGQYEGIMYDIEAVPTIRILAIQTQMLATDGDSITLYTKEGTHVGFESDSNAWTDLGKQDLRSPASDGFSNLYVLAEPLLMIAGERRALYLFDNTTARIRIDATPGPSETFGDANLLTFVGTGTTSLFVPGLAATPEMFIYYEVVDTSPPVVKLVGQRKVKTNESRVSVGGVASSDPGIDFVRLKYKRLRGDGTTKTITRKVNADASGYFERKVPTIAGGRNRVRAKAFDILGASSANAVQVFVWKD